MEDDEILNEFIQEAKEHLEGIEEDLLAIEDQGADVDADLVNKVFRAIHSIKGAAGFFELNVIKDLAHITENVLNKIRHKELVADSAISSVLLRSVDKLNALIEDVKNSNDCDVSDLLAELTAIDEGTAVPAAEAPPAADAAEETEAEAPPTETEVPAQAAPVEEKTEPQKSRAEASDDNGSLRVPLKTLNSLMNLAGELVLGRNQLLETLKSRDVDKVLSAAQRVNVITSDLQDAIMSTRMQPIGRVFNRFNRVVRDLANTLNKKVNLEIEGKEVELDKTIIESIVDPLTHLVRNAVDHGIESTEERAQTSKSPVGTIKLRAFHKAGHVIVEIIDDGKGIDPEKIRAKALRDEILSQEALDQMSDEDVLQLIFRPGFSLAKQVTEVSGRGVGMDVVHSNFTKLGGVVDIESTLGEGCIIRIKLPLTLAIIPSLIVRVQDDLLAIPQASLCELVSIAPDVRDEKIQYIAGSPFLRMRDGLLPLVSLQEILGMEKPEQDLSETETNVAIVSSGKQPYGLIVDDFLDSEEIVVKPLGRHIKGCQNYSGITIRGDGRLALIIDVLGISQSANLPTQAEIDESTGGEAQEQEESQHFLVIRNSKEEQFALPLGLMRRIEQYSEERLEYLLGKPTLHYSDRSLPLLTLDQLGEEEGDTNITPTGFVFVFNCHGREIGLIADELVDTVETTQAVDHSTFVREGILGSLMIDERTTLVLDMYAFARQRYPSWFEEAKSELSAVAKSGVRPNVLVVDDSNFYRRQISQFVQELDCDVTVAEDGIDAYEQLEATHRPFDMVFTDIEMPRMDGIEFIKKVRSTEQFRDLPLIAVTSLAGLENEKKIRDAGADEYMVKLARDEFAKVLNAYRSQIPSRQADTQETQS